MAKLAPAWRCVRCGGEERYASNGTCIRCASDYRNRPENRVKANARRLEWQRANAQRVRDLQKAGRQKPERKETDIARRARWVVSNIGRARGHARAYYWRNQEKQIACARAWQTANPDAARAIADARRARKAGAPGKHTGSEWRQCLESYGGLCVYCLRKATTKDHLVALTSGGSNHIGNIVPACKSCNSSKHASPLLVWLTRRASTPQQERK